MAHAVERPFPRGPLLGAIALVFFSLAVAGAVRIAGTPSMHPSGGAQIASRDLRFEDRSDGSVAVFNAATGAFVDRLAPGTSGFVRATLRGLASERKLELNSHASSATPFRLTAWADGRLTLDDLATGRHVELEAFGPTNAGAYAQILERATR